MFVLRHKSLLKPNFWKTQVLVNPTWYVIGMVSFLNKLQDIIIPPYVLLL